MDEEDLIVEEIPVFCSKSLSHGLYVLQYPTKVNEDNAFTKVANCTIKPINDEVKIGFKLNTNLKYFDRAKSLQWAALPDEKTHSKNRCNDIIDKQTFNSVKTTDNIDKYVLGTLQNNEIYLSPLKNILQLRPSFSYFDKEDKRVKEEHKSDEIHKNVEEGIKHVTVRFSRTDIEKNKEKENTYDYLIEKSKEEPWCEMMWHYKGSSYSELRKQKLFVIGNETNALNLNNELYVKKLLNSKISNKDLETISLLKAEEKNSKLISLKEELKTMLKDAKMLRFAEIMHILGKYENITIEKVLRTLPLVGTLICGNWVPISEILYPPETVSNYNGVPSELMVKGRDYILYKFAKQEYLQRSKLISTTQLPHEEIHEILKSVGRLNAEKKWELLLPPDPVFETRYPELVQRQEVTWRAIENIFNEMDYEKSPKRVRKRSVKLENKC